MKLTTLTGVTQSNDIRITKGFQALIFETNISPSELSSEKVDIEVVRASGNNISIARDFPLHALISLSNFGENVGIKDGDLYKIMVPISDGNISLSENDNVRLKLTDLVATNTYAVYSYEVPMYSDSVFEFTQKVFLSEEKNKAFIVENNDVIAIQNTSKLREVSFTYVNGISTKHDAGEIQLISNDVDNIAFIDNGSAQIRYKDNMTVLPLIGVAELELTKISGVVNIYLLNENAD